MARLVEALPLFWRLTRQTNGKGSAQQVSRKHKNVCNNASFCDVETGVYDVVTVKKQRMKLDYFIWCFSATGYTTN